MKPLVSVIVPIYNAAPFLEETMAQVLCQTFGAYEVLLCDDGSTDGSTGIARTFARRYPDKIRYVEHPDHVNRGQFSTRILGARHAAAPVLALLDADDIWEKEYLEKHYDLWRFLEPQGVFLSYGPSLYWHFETPDKSNDFVQEMPPGAPRIFQPGELHEMFLHSGYANTPCPSCTFVRKEVFDALSQFEAEARETLSFEDQLVCWYVAMKWPISVHGNVWVKYRQHRRSSVASITNTRRVREAEIVLLRLLRNAFEKECPGHPLVRDGTLTERMERLSRPLSLRERLREAAYEYLPAGACTVLRRVVRSLRAFRAQLPAMPFIRTLRCAQFRRLRPLREGRQRGTPIVRHYWDVFLMKNSRHIHGRCLEVGSTATLRRFGSKSPIQADAIDLVKHSPEITVVADLTKADHVPSDVYDCFVNQFTMTFIYDAESALYHSVRILKPGGVLLLNFPCVEYYFATGLDMDTGPPIFMYWWFTPIMVENLLRRIGVAEKDYTLEIFGNLFSRIAYQMNMPAEELTPAELEYQDSGHPLLICARVVKPVAWEGKKPEHKEPWVPQVAPAKWNPLTHHYPLPE